MLALANAPEAVAAMVLPLPLSIVALGPGIGVATSGLPRPKIAVTAARLVAAISPVLMVLVAIWGVPGPAIVVSSMFEVISAPAKAPPACAAIELPMPPPISASWPGFSEALTEPAVLVAVIVPAFTWFVASVVRSMAVLVSKLCTMLAAAFAPLAVAPMLLPTPPPAAVIG